MKEKKLPVKYPIITCHPPTAGLMSILNNYSYTKSWIYSNYIQFVGGIRDKTVYGGGSFDVAILPSYHAEKNCPWILHSQLTRITIHQFSDSIIDFIIKALDTENYVYLVIDEFFISKTIPGKEQIHMPHDIFVYGYSLEKRLLYVGDFTFNESKKFAYETVPFEEFEKGYNVITPQTDFFYYEKGGVALLNFYNDAKYLFDKKFVKEQFLELYESTDLSEKYRSTENPFYRRAYGIEVYDLLTNFLKEASSEYRGLTKSLAILKDHKQLMVERLKYMDDNGYLKNSEEFLLTYKKILEQFSIMVSLSIKFSITNKKSNIDKILDILVNTKTTEKDVIRRIIES